MICVDASVAAKWILDEERTDRARALYDATLATGATIIAPPLLPIEVTNILRQRLRSNDDFTIDEALTLLEQFLALPIALHNPGGLHRRALVLAQDYGLPAAYDAHYLALAEHFGCALWTDDGRLWRAVAGHLSFVHQIGDFDGL